MYTITTMRGINIITRSSDGAIIPHDEANADYQAYAAWSQSGNIAQASAPATSAADVQAAVAAHIDSVARGRGFDGAADCASYQASANAGWRADANAFVSWRDGIWSTTLTALDASAALPSGPAFVASLPAITWPSP